MTVTAKEHPPASPQGMRVWSAPLYLTMKGYTRK